MSRETCMIYKNGVFCPTKKPSVDTLALLDDMDVVVSTSSICDVLLLYGWVVLIQNIVEQDAMQCSYDGPLVLATA